MITPQAAISYLNRWVHAALAAGQPKLYFPFFSSWNVTTSGIRGSARHEFQGRYGDPIKAAQSVLNSALIGMPRSIERFRKQYADWEGPGKPPAWLDQVTLDLMAMGAFAGMPATPPPVVPSPPAPPPAPPPTTMTVLEALVNHEERIDALEDRIRAVELDEPI